MKITRVTYERLELKLSEPYTIAYETVSHATNFILKIETETSIYGYGCAAPDLEVTGENPDEVENLIKRTIIPFLTGKNVFRFVRILVDLKELSGKSPSALAMVDMALLDIAARKMGIPMYQYLGGYRKEIPTSITIGILSIEETVRQATEFVKKGFTIIKVKGGLSLQEDIEKMILIRERFPDITLRFDGNQGYNVEEAVDFVKGAEKVGIEIFEQPSKVKHEQNLGLITEQVNLPVMADESLKTLKDAFRLAQNERIDMINIKIMKVGGITEAMHINSVAKSAGLETMVGCIDECSLGIAAGLHFALSRPNIHYADLDGHLDMLNDPFKGLFKLNKGILTPYDVPGLGNIG